MTKTKIGYLIFGLIMLSISSSRGLLTSCMMEYDNGGAPAIYDSVECPEWVLSVGSPKLKTPNCQFATRQGRREYQEDRITCNLDMKVPLLGKDGFEEDNISVVAIFDGHGGKEASEMASKLLLDYFYLHTAFQSHQTLLEYKGDFPLSKNRSLQLEILKKALHRTIQDIDQIFFREASKYDISSGSTAVVVLVFHGQMLVANVGDSKALLFSQNSQYGLTAQDESETEFTVTELTSDHHPDREDERSRIEGVGGSVIVRGVARVNGMLAISRSIGDLRLKRFGVIAEPEFREWQPLTANDMYMLVASDGIFESLTPKGVGDLVSKWHSQFKRKQELQSCFSLSSLAQLIINTAYDEGSWDNLSAIVIPLNQKASLWGHRINLKLESFICF